jgi:hypothetical protein
LNNDLATFKRIQELAFATLEGEHRPGTLHDLRRTFGATMANAGVPMHVLKSYIGQSTIKVTERFFLDTDGGWDEPIRSIVPGQADRHTAERAQILPMDASTPSEEIAEVDVDPASRYRNCG